MKRVFIFLTILGMMSGMMYAQSISKKSYRAEIIAKGGYYLSSGTPSGSIEAMLAARKFGCYASSCTVMLTDDKQLVVVLGAERLKIEKNMTVEQLKKNGFWVMPVEEYFVKYTGGQKSQAPQPSALRIVGDNVLSVNENGDMDEKLNAKMRLVLNVHASDSRRQMEMIGLLKKLVRVHGLSEKVDFASTDLELCRLLAENFQKSRVTYMQGDLSPKAISKRAGEIGCQYDYETLRDNPNWFKEAKALKMPVWVGDVHDKLEVKEMLEKGVNGFLTENVALVSAWAERKPLVKLMSFNIRMSGMSEYDGVNAWKNRKEAVVRMFKEQNPDVVGVQEMLPDQQAFLRKELREYNMVGLGRDDGQKEGECMGIFYKTDRFALKDSGTFWLSQTPESASMGWDAACKRTVTYVKLKDMQSGKSFYYFNTHLDHVGKIARQESVKLIAEKIREIVGDTNSVFVLGGDMNSPVYDRIFTPIVGAPTPNRKNTSEFAISKVSNAARTEANNGALMKICRSNAWQRDNSITYNGYGKDKASQIDHLFSSIPTENLVFQTLKKDYGVPYISDHYPIILIFSLK